MKLVKCIHCSHSDSIDEIINNDNKVVYKCYACGKTSSQAVSLDSRLKLELSKTGDFQHQSVGILVRNEKNELLMLKRRFFPFSWAIVFGHVHNGEKFEDAARRELIEETGIKAGKLRPILEEHIDVECRTHVKSHHVKIFELRVSDDTYLIPNSESEQMVWTNIRDIAKSRKPLGESSRMILTRLKLDKAHASKK